MAQLENIEAIEKRLWNAADTLRATFCPPRLMSGEVVV